MECLMQSSQHYIVTKIVVVVFFSIFVHFGYILYIGLYYVHAQFLFFLIYVTALPYGNI